MQTSDTCFCRCVSNCCVVKNFCQPDSDKRSQTAQAGNAFTELRTFTNIEPPTVFVKKQDFRPCRSNAAAMVKKKITEWHNKTSYVIGTKLSCLSMFAFFAMAGTSTSI